MANRTQQRSSFGGYLIASAGIGVAGGLALGAALLAADAFGLFSLLAAGNEASAAMALFALGLGALLAPVGLATALALPHPGDLDAAPHGKPGEDRGNPGPASATRLFREAGCQAAALNAQSKRPVGAGCTSLAAGSATVISPRSRLPRSARPAAAVRKRSTSAASTSSSVRLRNLR